MEQLLFAAEVVGALSTIGVVVAMVVRLFLELGKIREGMKCQLRSDMLRTYYKHHEQGTIRQYEYENFLANYQAYKALKGNSFIDKIYGEVKTWEVLT